MKIGIIVAMEKELRLLLPLLDNGHSITNEGFTFYNGTIAHHQVCIMKCGIGKVNAALGCSSMIRSFEPQLVINTGVAGGTGAAEVLDVVAATAVGYHDVWCGPGTIPGEAAGCPRLFPAAPDALEALNDIDGIKYGVMASGDIFVDRPETVKKILEIYPDALGCDMESGALAQTCHHFGVPFFCLRVISDTPGRVSDNGAQYESFWEAAPQETFETLTALLRKL
ncbi:MAG: 5'-methylthioadenosine/S-adenosylhomocysteine nucleosidase [Muribaculaceae bacterium]|nr:5'-methylthioadenosine/S-adenosylhomocysteine nucleosidase [Muribaculaceae bacterium]